MAIRRSDDCSAVLNDAGVISEIYTYYNNQSIATFEEVEFTTSEMALRIQANIDLNLPWLVIEEGGIALPNNACVALPEKLGIQQAAHYKEVGFKFDQWIDVGYW